MEPEDDDADDGLLYDPLKGMMFVPDVLANDGDLKPVRPPRESAGELASILRDLLAGELQAGQAALDWLKDRIEDPERKNQFFGLLRLLRLLFRAAMLRAERAHNQQRYLVRTNADFAGRIARDWGQFCGKVTELFAFDLFEAEDAVRFVNEVVLPGKLEGYGEAA